MTAATPPPPVLDHAVLDQLAGLLPAAVLATNLRRLATIAEALLAPLAADPAAAAGLAEQAHALAGSAGLLGFKRLSAACLDYEAACAPRSAGRDPGPAGRALLAALEATLPEITRRIAG